jgi:hypothetical protein
MTTIETFEELMELQPGTRLWDHHNGIPSVIRAGFEIKAMPASAHLLQGMLPVREPMNKVVYLIEIDGQNDAALAGCLYDGRGYIFRLQ